MHPIWQSLSSWALDVGVTAAFICVLCVYRSWRHRSSK